MAGQVPRDKVFGNFKQSRVTGPVKSKNSEKFKDRPGMSDEHLTMIRQLPCCCCLKVPGGEAHHLKDTPDKERGMGLRSTDKWTVPLCNEHHIHGVERVGSKNEHAYFKQHGIENVVLLANDLWKSSGNKARMTAVVIAHKTHR